MQFVGVSGVGGVSFGLVPAAIALRLVRTGVRAINPKSNPANPDGQANQIRIKSFRVGVTVGVSRLRRG